jgi:hypothetical protein
VPEAAACFSVCVTVTTEGQRAPEPSRGLLWGQQRCWCPQLLPETPTLPGGFRVVLLLLLLLLLAALVRMSTILKVGEHQRLFRTSYLYGAVSSGTPMASLQTAIQQQQQQQHKEQVAQGTTPQTPVCCTLHPAPHRRQNIHHRRSLCSSLIAFCKLPAAAVLSHGRSGWAVQQVPLLGVLQVQLWGKNCCHC